MTDIKLVVLDFDGTVMCYDEEPGFFHPEIVNLLNEMEDRGIAWCANSGRTLDSQVEVLEASAERGLRHWPCGILCDERLIFERREDRFMPLSAWNRWADDLTARLHQHVRAALAGTLPRWRAEYAFSLVRLDTLGSAFCLREDGEQPEQFFRACRDHLAGVPGSRVIRNGQWVAVIPDQLGKGHQLRRFLMNLRLPARRVLAVGDHINDLPMLEGWAAAHVGCPADSAPEVIRAVTRAGGTVAAENGPLGTREILQRVVETQGDKATARPARAACAEDPVS